MNQYTIIWQSATHNVAIKTYQARTAEKAAERWGAEYPDAERIGVLEGSPTILEWMA